MEIFQLLGSKKDQLIEFICKELLAFDFTNVQLLERTREFVEQEISAFIAYLKTDDQGIPRNRGRENAVREIGDWIVSYLFFSMLEYINEFDEISPVAAVHFIKHYMAEFLIAHDRETRDGGHQKQNQLLKAFNIIIQKQDAELAIIRLNAQYRQYKISETERIIIELVRQGKKNKEIARIMCISAKTVERHLNNIYEKCDKHSRGALLKFFKVE